MTVQSSFVDDVYGKNIPVIAGAILPDPEFLEVLDYVDQQTINAYVGTWVEALLHYPRFVAPWTTDICGGKCKSYLLPGSLYQIYFAPLGTLGQGILSATEFQDVEAIRVYNAPGIGLVFQDLSDEDDFNLEIDCQIKGESPTTSVQLCGKQTGSSIAVGTLSVHAALQVLAVVRVTLLTASVLGWRVCPAVLKSLEQCDADNKWKTEPLSTKTLMAVYEQQVTTTYEWKTMVITDVHAESTPKSLALHLDMFKGVWDRIFKPASDTEEAVPGFEEHMQWLSTKNRPSVDPRAPMEELQNFLALVIHFALTAKQFVNGTRAEHSLTEDQDLISLPPGMLTTATGGRRVQRFVAQRWATWCFMTSGSLITVVCGICLVWILRQNGPIPKGMGVLEFDSVARAATSRAGTKRTGNLPENTITVEEYMMGLSEKQRSSIRAAIRPLGTARVMLHRQGETDGGNRILLLPDISGPPSTADGNS